MSPETLGPYRIDRELGSGGMGKVYGAIVEGRAPGLAAGARVALKVVHPHLLETPGFFQRFVREAELGASVRHPNVVRTLGCDQQTARGVTHCYMVMEYVEGQTLSALCDELERVPEELCRHVAREICRGLAAIHAAGIVHRDIKPANVLITPEHDVKLMDLGVALLMDEAIRLSRSGAFVGSVEYASPEQFKGGDVDGRTDLYSLGVLLYELAAGTHPYRGGGFHEVLGRVLTEEPRALGEVNPQLSAFFEEVVHTLLVKDVRGRFASADDVFTVLEEGEESQWWRKRSRALRDETRRPIRRIRIPRETAVYGRDAELTTLRELYERARAGDGQVILLDGEAGIGKSRLVDELIARLHADGEDVNFLFGSYPPTGAASAAGAFSTAFYEQFGDDGAAPYLSQTPLLVPAFDALLRGDAAPPEAQPLTRDSLATCFVLATRELAAERTTIILIDDLHFAPDDARALFTSLAMSAPGQRVLVIGTTRPGVSKEWVAGLTRLPHTSTLTVQRLGPKDLVRLLEDTLRSTQLAEELSAKIAVKSDGNPFFAFAIIRGLREGQFLTQKDDGSWASTRVIDDIEIPSSVLDLVSARVADLTDDDRNLLDVAACWGYEFDASLVGDALGLRRLPVLQAMAKIEKRDRLVRSSGRHFVFDHHQVQEALYGALPEMLREEYHAALAAALETRTNAADKDTETLGGALCVDLCEHFLKGARGESAVRYLAAAQTHLTEGYLHAQVVALSERALSVPDLLAGTERAKTLLRLANALDPLGRRARQEECAREAEQLAELAGDDDVRSQAARVLGVVLARTSRHAAAETAFRRSLDLARACGDLQGEARATLNVGNACFSLNRLSDARACYERAVAISRESRDRSGEADATANVGRVFFSLGRLPEAQEHHERALAFYRETGNRPGEAIATANLGSVFTSLGRLPEARERYERALAICRETGHREGEANATLNVGNALFSLRRLAEARECYERAYAIYRDVGDRQGEGNAAVCLGSVSWSLDRLPEAQEHYERALAILSEIGDRSGEAMATANLGFVFSSLGRLPEARERFERALTIHREIGARSSEGSTLLDLAWLADEEGRAAEALRLAAQSLAVRREIGHGVGVADALLEVGDLQRRAGDPVAARAALEEAGLLAGEQGRKAEVALVLALLACLPGGDAKAAQAAFADAGESEHGLRVSHLLWQATGDRVHLEESKRRLDETLASVPAEHHEAMLTNLRMNREIMAAWNEASGDDDDGAVTRVSGP